MEKEKTFQKKTGNQADEMANSIVVGESYHFWLSDEDSIYDEKYGKKDV